MKPRANSFPLLFLAMVCAAFGALGLLFLILST